MLPVEQVESIILSLVQPLDAEIDQEKVAITQVSGRILTKSVVSSLDFPHWDNSAMDGYAVRYQDVEDASIDHPKLLEIIEEIPAGSTPKSTIKMGQAARIFTGSCIPNGADIIVIQEDTKREGNQVKILSSPTKPQAFIRHQGSYYKAGETPAYSWHSFGCCGDCGVSSGTMYPGSGLSTVAGGVIINGG
ncbi:Molybdopterin molybdenumtransferase [Planktothrix agardhii]|nr:Molybdopterin molybdenumtransferase [Planktothrix agardhii]